MEKGLQQAERGAGAMGSLSEDLIVVRAMSFHNSRPPLSGYSARKMSKRGSSEEATYSSDNRSMQSIILSILNYASLMP